MSHMTPAFYEGSNISSSWNGVSHTMRLKCGRKTQSLSFNLSDN